jgi:hypothetical protein
MEFVIAIRVRDVAEGDVTDLAQQVWDEHAESFDAPRGDFELSISMVHPGGNSFPFEWEPA